MNRRIARKIFDRYHNIFCFDGTGYPRIPKDFALYLKAVRCLGIKTYYDHTWLRRMSECKAKYGTFQLTKGHELKPIKPSSKHKRR